MASSMSCALFFLAASACFAFCQAEETDGGLVERARTFVQSNMRRFLIILPAIFFKLGVAFTMLVLVTMVSVNNGLIGFLILVVGLSSILARFQPNSPPGLLPYQQHPPLYAYHRNYHDWDRNDKGADSGAVKQVYLPYTYGQSSG